MCHTLELPWLLLGSYDSNLMYSQYTCVNSTLNITCYEPRVIVVWYPDPFLLTRFCTCAVKRGREERKESEESAYPSTDPGRNAVVGDKYALVTTVYHSVSQRTV